MAQGQAANREGIIDAVVLAMSVSELKDIVGSDALRSVLTGQYRDMFSKSTLRLQVVWDLLQDQPGFSAEKAKPPFCALKMWEEEMGITAELPSSLAGLSRTEIMALASHNSVPKTQRMRVFHPEETRKQARIAATKSVTEPSKPITTSRKPALEAVLAVVALIGVGFAIYTVAGYVSGPTYESAKVEDISSILPIKSAKKLGSDLNVILSDDDWLAQSEEEKQQALQQALTALKDSKVEVLIVLDSSGTPRASAQWLGNQDSIQVRLH